MHERVTVSLPAELVAQARRAVETGSVASISSYVAEAVSARADRERALAELERVFGSPPPAEQLTAARRALRGEQAPRSA